MSTTTHAKNASKTNATTKRKQIVTISLPYANGPLHLGHMVEAWQADIWSRFQKMRGNDCLFICGSDAHGTPIMLAAEKNKLTADAYTDQIHQQHAAEFKKAGVAFDIFYSTNSPETEQVVTESYLKMQQCGDISTKEIEQAYDEQAGMFLPDRYIKGQCPRCDAKDQYGDSCEVCGATYTNTELKHPYSIISNTTPVTRKTEHQFFELPNYEEALKNWVSNASHLQSSAANKLKEWFKEGLKAWDIARDEPYFGIEIPESGDFKKYFYVWFSAPLGYLSIFKKLCSLRPQLDWNEYWKKDSDTELHHFIGKDVMYFHALFWPAMLISSGYRTPTSVRVHGFLTINGAKMSKSRGTFITVEHYLNHFSSSYLRYFFATKLSDQVEDIDLSSEDFVQRVNSDLIGKFINIGSRCARFINRDFNNQTATTLHRPELCQRLIDASTEVACCYEKNQYSHAMRQIMECADYVNQYIDEMKPWTLAKKDPSDTEIQLICTQGLECFRQLTLMLAPVIPQLASQIGEFLNTPLTQWSAISTPILNHCIKPFKPLLQRLDLEKVKNVFDHQ